MTLSSRLSDFSGDGETFLMLLLLMMMMMMMRWMAEVC